MRSPFWFLVILAAGSAGCSQRAAWRTVPEPAPRVVAQQANAVSPPDATSSAPAFATAAPVVPAVLDASASTHLSGLLFPVPGVESTRLDDSFNEPRDSGTRRHAAIDIMAPRGTPVLAADDGRILRLSNNPRGGISMYTTDLEEHFVYYYAHLDRYHPRLYQGKPLARGDTIGYVGTTGNAPENLPHLHFQVMRMPANHQYWNGEPINPYPFLRQNPSVLTAP